MRRHCRCRKCDARKTLSKRPAEYLRPPKCPCGGSYRLDKWADSRPWRKNMCRCSGVPFPHRPGMKGPILYFGGELDVWCIHAKPTEETTDGSEH